MNARAVFAEVAEISRLALQMAEAGRAAGLHNIALFSKDVPPVEEHLILQYDRSKRIQEDCPPTTAQPVLTAEDADDTEWK